MVADMTEPGEELMEWASPTVIVPKSNDIRICVDMRQVNQAIVRDLHPILTIEEMLRDMNRRASQNLAENRDTVSWN